MPVITTTDLQNAKTDANDLGSLVNGFTTVSTRTGGNKQSYSELMGLVTHGTISTYDPTETITTINQWRSYTNTSVSPNVTTVYRPIPSALPIAPTSPLSTAPDTNKWVVAAGDKFGDKKTYVVESYAELRALPSASIPDGAIIIINADGIGGMGTIKTNVASPNPISDNGGTLIVFTDDSNRYFQRLGHGIDPANVRWFGATGLGSGYDDTTACQNAINYADSFNISLVLFPQGVYDVTGLTFPDDINPIGSDSAFGLTFNFTSTNRWGSVIQNTTTSSPTLRWTKSAGHSHTIPAHLKITGNSLQTSVVKFDYGVFNNSGMQNCGVYSFESGTAGPGATYCIEFANGGFDFFMSHCYTGKGATANFKVGGDSMTLHLTSHSCDVAGDCLVETDFACDINMQNCYFENTNSAFNLVNHNGTLTSRRPSLNIFGIRNTTVPFNSIWNNVNTASEFVVPQIECTGWKGQYPTYIFQDSAGTNDTNYPGIRSGWSFYTGAGKTNFMDKKGTVPGNQSSINVGGSNALYNTFTINSFNIPVVIEEIQGGTEGRIITIVEIGGPGGSGSASFATTPNAISVSSLTRSGSTATATTAAAHYYVTGDTITIAGANETDYNGSFTITVTGTTTFTYTVPNSPASPATGTITSVHTNANIVGNDSLPIYGGLRSAYVFQYVSGKWEYLTNNDIKGHSGKRLSAYATDAAAGAAGLVSGQLYYYNDGSRYIICRKI